MNLVIGRLSRICITAELPSVVFSREHSKQQNAIQLIPKNITTKILLHKIGMDTADSISDYFRVMKLPNKKNLVKKRG